MSSLLSRLLLLTFLGLLSFCAAGQSCLPEGIIFHNDGLDTGTLDSLVIIENSSLTDCDIQSVCNYLGVPVRRVKIEDNAPGCQSRDEVVAGCTAGTHYGTCITQATVWLFPNPVTKFATIEVQVQRQQPVRLAAFDLYGREVAEVIDHILPAGVHRFKWDVGAQPPGIYLIRMQAGDLRILEKLVIGISRKI